MSRTSKLNNTTNFEEEFLKKIYQDLKTDFSKYTIFIINKIIKFPVLFFWFSQKYRFDKKTVKAILRELERREYIEIIPYNGIRILSG